MGVKWMLTKYTVKWYNCGRMGGKRNVLEKARFVLWNGGSDWGFGAARKIERRGLIRIR